MCEQSVLPKNLNPVKAWNLTIMLKKSGKSLNLRIFEKTWSFKQVLHVK